MSRQAMTEKILVLGVDGMDPKMTKQFLAEGILPNIQKYLDRGAAREDLVLLGSQPTITPPLWTTLATGAEPRTHGITCFWNQSHENLATMTYSLDSRLCKAEQIWNIFAEDANKKTLVWHWPGSSFPPTSTSPNLHVVDGAQPAFVNMGSAMVDSDKRLFASETIEEVTFAASAANSESGAGCIITDLPQLDVSTKETLENLMGGGKEVTNIMLSNNDGELAFDKAAYDLINSPIKPAQGWADAPDGAKEFTMLTCKGLVRRPGLILKNSAGIYDTVNIYKNKKASEPIVSLQRDGKARFYILDEVLMPDGRKIEASRTYKMLELAPDGSQIKLWCGVAFDINNDSMWFPKSLYKEVIENVGLIPTVGICGSHEKDFVDLSVEFWAEYLPWQANSIKHLIKAHGYEAVFTHVHNVDQNGHTYFHFAKAHKSWENLDGEHIEEGYFQDFIRTTYRQTDAYLGEFLPLLDEGWTIFIVSDHGILIKEEEDSPLIGDAFGCNVGVLKQLGYTAVTQDINGNDLKEIDWANTRAIATRGAHIWINLKGRNTTGIVEPEDKYALEAQIISDLYNYRFEGKRVISMAIRNKDAVALGMGGSECGDILYWLEEGFNRPHGDALSTYEGYFNSSVSPIFIAAGQGIKQGFTIERLIKQVDVASTIAALGGIRMPAQNEGSVIHQIFTQEF